MSFSAVAVALPARPILLVDADGERGCAIAEQLGADGFAVRLARSGEHARMLAAASAPRLALLGRLHPPRAVVELLGEIRRQPGRGAAGAWDPALPVIVLEPRARALDTLRAFDAGADDVLAGTASYLELRARVRALLRRAERTLPDAFPLRAGPLTIDARTHLASLHDRPLQLRRMEFSLLARLASDPDRVFTKQELLRAVWGDRSGSSTRTLDSHASRLRRKLHEQGAPGWVVNVWGVGYRLI